MRRYLFLPFAALLVVSCMETKSRLQSVTTDDGIQISENDSRVLFYQVQPKSQNGKFERTNYVHPLYSMKENVITEDFPADHPYHHGIYSAWHQIVLNDSAVADGWTSNNISWEVVDAKAVDHEDAVTIESEVLWKSLLEGKAESIVREESKITVHRSNDQSRIIDFDLDIYPLKDSLKLGGSEDEKGYGGFCVRLKLPEDIRFIAKSQEVEAQVLSIEAGQWMNFVGSFDGKDFPPSGLLILQHPSNPGNPQPWILRKEKSMQNAAFPGRQPLELEKDGWHFRYRVVIHNGSLDEKAIEELYQQYAKI
jgi:hypothetical protein